VRAPRGSGGDLDILLGTEGDDPGRLFGLSRGIAKALNEGELALVQIYGLRIPIARLDSRQLKPLAATAPFIKLNFNPDEAHDHRGRWTDADGGRPDAGTEREAIPPRRSLGRSAAPRWRAWAISPPAWWGRQPFSAPRS
jgi:hypothetical protein